VKSGSSPRGKSRPFAMATAAMTRGVGPAEVQGNLPGEKRSVRFAAFDFECPVQLFRPHGRSCPLLRAAGKRPADRDPESEPVCVPTHGEATGDEPRVKCIDGHPQVGRASGELKREVQVCQLGGAVDGRPPVWAGSPLQDVEVATTAACV
jgi:hypothetical protein